MKKTNSTFAKIWSNVLRRHSSANPLSLVVTLAMMLVGHFAFGQIMDPCSPGSGNVVLNCPPTNPAPIPADASCQAVVPDFKPGVSGTAGAGYAFVGVVQVPMAGTLLSGVGNHNIQVGAAFLNLPPPGGTADSLDGTLCAEVCPTIIQNVFDNTMPVISCASPQINADASCQVVLTEAIVRAQLLSGLSDNCTTDPDSIAITFSPSTLAGPSCPADPNPVVRMVTVTATDAAGNVNSCVANVGVADLTPPVATFNPFPNGTNMDTIPAIDIPGLGIFCGNVTPDLTGMVTAGADNCGGAVNVFQAPPAGTPYTLVINPATGCVEEKVQPIDVTVEDCYNNDTTFRYYVHIQDQTPPTITSTCAAVPPQATLVADANCMVNVPDLTGFMTASDNCVGPQTWIQTPVGLTDVSGVCPPNNTIDVTFIAVDCFGNQSAPLTCPALLTFTDNTAPAIVCPPAPITVVVPFDGATCQTDMAVIDLAFLIANGVTVEDACDPNPVLTGLDPEMFTCADINKANLTIDIEATDCFNNVGTGSCPVNVVADIDLTPDWGIAGNDFIVCPDEFPVCIEFGPNTPACGVWSGDVAVSVWSGAVCASGFALEAASFPDLDNDGTPDPGSYSITYTVGPPGCHVSETHNIMISPQFNTADAALIADTTVCMEATEMFDLEGLLAPGSIQGGLYSVTLTGNASGQVLGNLFQYLGGDGDLIVAYLLEDCDANIETDTVIVSIDEKPDGHFTLPANFCQDEGSAAPIITGVPTGASIEFTSLPAGYITNAATGLFDPAAGPLAGEFADVFVTMRVTNGVCDTFFVSQWVVVYASGDPAFVIPDTICESAAPLNLVLTNPLNDNGINTLLADNINWTGTGVTDIGTTGFFNPQDLAPGYYTICVTVGAPSCEEQLCQDIFVAQDYTPAEVALVDDLSLCLLPDDIIDFSGLLANGALPGGTFTVTENGDLNGFGTINANNYIYRGECGTLEIVHFFPDDCVPNSDTIVITIEQKPDVGGLAIPGPLCAQDPTAFIEYSGTPVVCNTPGVFTAPISPAGTISDLGTGTTAIFDPVAAGEGVHIVQYEIGNPLTGCYAILFGQIEVEASSDPEFTLPSTSCANEVVDLALDLADPSVLPTSPDAVTEVYWFGGDGLNAVVTDNGDGTGTFVGYRSGTYTVCVQTGDLGCTQFKCHQITVDNVPPVLNCAPQVRTRDNATGVCTYTATGVEFDVTATDNCSPPNDPSSIILTHNYAPYIATNDNSLDGATFPVGITQVVWTATDTAGNSASCTIQIVVVDNEDPTVTSCPADITIGTDADICGAELNYVLPQFADNCDGTGLEGVLVAGYAPGADFPVGTTTVTWEYTDLADNTTAVCTFNVTVEDDDNPTPICSPAYAVSLDGDGEFDVLATDIDNGSYDNCQVVSTLISRTGAAPFSGSVTMTCADVTVSPIIVTLQVTDQAGNTSTCTTAVTVNDDQVPDIECAGNITVHADPNVCAAVVTYPAPIVVDNCSYTVTQIDGTGLTSGSSFPVGTTVQTYKVTDIAGNMDTCSFTVFVYDEIAPTIDCGPTVRTQSANPGVCTFTMPGAGFDAVGADNCGIVTITHNYPTAVNPNTLAGSTFPVGTTLVTWIATDASGNQSAICGIEIVITDDENPTITCTAAPTVFDNDPGLCSYKVTNTNLDPTAGDNCPDFEVTHDYAMAPSNNSLNGAVFPVGSTNVGFTVTDAAGNTATCSITVTVNDTEDPVFINCPTTMVMIGNDPDQCSGKLNWSIPVATDNCELASVIQSGGPANGTQVPVGMPMTVTYTATDIYGNSSTCVFDVQVVDTQNPEFDADILMPGNVTVECNAVPAPFVLTNDDVHDNCTPSNLLVIAFTQTSTQGNNPNNCNFYNYTITRTWTVTDQAGNVLSHTQIITVQDTQAPVPTCQDATLTLDKNGSVVLDPLTLIAGTTDNCAPFSALTVTASQTTFTCANLGPNNVTLTISDPCGNTATCTVVVTVNQGPGACTPTGSLASSCLNNATTLTNGQFEELITITGLAMQTWNFTAVNGLYTNTSANPPAAPTPLAVGTALTMGTADGIDNDGDGQIDEADEMVFYTIRARYVEAIGYTATVTNNLGQTVTLSNVGHYPTPIISGGPFGPFCLSTPAFVPTIVDQFAGANAYVSVSFLVDGVPVTQVDPSTLSVGQHTLTVIVDAGSAAFSRRINGVLVPGDAANSNDARLNPGCIQSITQFFQVVTTPSQVVCNDLIHVTLEADCNSTITPDDVLEGSYACFDDYEVHIFLPNGIPLNPHNVVTGAHVGLNLNYILVHPVSGNTCWGHILVEDKINPVAICPGDVEILCTVDPDSVVYWVPPTSPRFPAKDFWGNLVPINDSLLYLGEPTATDCSPWIWDFAYTDDYILYECTDNPALIAEITRTFIIQDIWGNKDTCQQHITWVRGEADHVNWPADIVIPCNAPNIDDYINADFHPDHTGWPYIWGPNDSRLSIHGNGICNLGLTYSDQLVNVCTEEYKIVRTWTLYDWCPANGGPPTQTVHVQYIKVENVAPIITVDCLEIDPATGYCVMNATEPGNYPHYPCYAIFVPYAQVEAVCDQIVDISVETPGGHTTNGGIIPGGGLPIGGPYVIIYRAEDQCGHITELELTVIVKDKTAPIAVCDEITDVNLSSDGLAEVFAETFDDGSYDGCCLDRFEVRKMNGDPCGLGGNFFGPSVTFCCEDIANSPVTVVFRAYDCYGNFNDCMVQVNVNDKTAPVRTFCPPDKRITCDWYADNLETQLQGLTGAQQCQFLEDEGFGEATFQDNCPLTISCNTSINLDQCLEGVITRTYTAVDAAGNAANQNCQTRIFVDHVSDWVVEFPADITFNCGSTAPNFGEPEIFYETCELVAVSYEDQVFNVVQDACYKILRTWKIINWCVVGNNIDQEVVEQPENQLGLVFPLCDLDGDGDCDNRTFRDSWNSSSKPSAAQATQTTNPDTDLDSDPWDGYITYQQTIKVVDNVDPVIVDCSVPDICILDNSCVASIQLPIPEVEECSHFVTISAQIRFNGVWTSAGSVELEAGVTTDAFTTFDNVAPGTYDVRYVVQDNCNNQKACETTVTVKDCKLPTPYCKDGLVIELMQTGMVATWARDFNAGSFDNCPGALKFSFSSNTVDTGRVYTCDSVGLRTVRIYVTDAAGNQDFCITQVEIQANQNQCGDDTLSVNVGGLIETEDNEGVEEVNVQLSGSSQNAMMTDANGMFNFAVVPGGDYTLTPVKDDQPLNGVTTYDLVLISKHILGVQALNSPYKLIAADANKSGTVTTFDLVTIRKVILFIDSTFPNNTSWRFVDKDFVFPNPQNPWQTVFPEVINVNNIAADQLAADFVAVKIGDVNSSAATSLTGGNEDRNANGKLVLAVDDVQLTAGQEYTVDFKARDFNVLGYQFTLNFDKGALEFVQVNSGVAGAENFGLTLLENGVITTSWNDNNANVADDQTVFSIVFKATTSVKLSDALSVNSRFTKAEAYKQNGDLLDVELVFNGAASARNFELYQNTPNPFSTYTVIGFNLPEAVAATLTITDVSGKVVKSVNQEFAKGYNEIKLERREMPATGILYYQLDTPTDSATKMMLLMD